MTLTGISYGSMLMKTSREQKESKVLIILRGRPEHAKGEERCRNFSKRSRISLGHIQGLLIWYRMLVSNMVKLLTKHCPYCS